MGAVGSDGYGRIAVRNPEDGARTLTPHQVGARLGYGPIPAGATVLHDCEVRLCCRAEPCGDGRLSGSAAGRGGPEYFRYFGWVFVTWVRGAGAVAMMNATLGRRVSTKRFPPSTRGARCRYLRMFPATGLSAG